MCERISPCGAARRAQAQPAAVVSSGAAALAAAPDAPHAVTSGTSSAPPWRERMRIAGSGRGRRSAVDGSQPTPSKQRGSAVDGGEPHEPIDDATGGVRRAEVLAEDPRHQVELADRDQSPVETADDHEDGGEDV